MQKSISKAAITWRLILSGFIITSLISCEESNSVGGQFIEESTLRFDTLYVENFTPLNEDVYSGNLRFVSIGVHNDPLFGTTKSTAFVKPRISSIDLSDSVNENYELKMKLIMNPSLTVGDTISQVNYDIYPVSDFWRGNDMRSNDNIGIDSSISYGSFTHLDQDSITIDLSEELLLELAGYINNESDSADSLYNYNFDGFAIVPRSGASKMLLPDMSLSRFFLISAGGDTTEFSSKTHGFIQDRTNGNVYNDRLYIESFFESFYKLNFNDELPQDKKGNLLKAEFIVYEDVTQLENSIPNFNSRLSVNFLELKFNDNSDLAYDLQFTPNDFAASRDSSINGFRFNITDHISQYYFTELSDTEILLYMNPSGGTRRSTLLFDQTSENSLKPKLILTFSE
jgi:hypothetical protein